MVCTKALSAPRNGVMAPNYEMADMYIILYINLYIYIYIYTIMYIYIQLYIHILSYTYIYIYIYSNIWQLGFGAIFPLWSRPGTDPEWIDDFGRSNAWGTARNIGISLVGGMPIPLKNMKSQVGWK